MPKIPQEIISPELEGLKLVHRGKVRDTYEIPDTYLMLVVATDRISIFDHVLHTLVPQKGQILTAMNIFWRQFFTGVFADDLMAFGPEIDRYLPKRLQENPELQARATVVRRLEMYPLEAIVRGFLTGSELESYTQSHRICGHRLPTQLQDGDDLPYLLFTPTTKAEIGHDEHITADSVSQTWGVQIERTVIQLFSMMQMYAASRGMVLADTKFELGRDKDQAIVFGDEIGTPDSSRYWDLETWRESRMHEKRRSPASFDKQLVREWGRAIGIKERNPMSDADVAWVQAQRVPAEVIADATNAYLYAFFRLTGMKLARFQKDRIRIDVKLPNVKIDVIAGSESDLKEMAEGLNLLSQASRLGHAEVRRHIISCHRNPEELAAYVRALPLDRVLIAGAGKAAALPGMLKALLTHEGKSRIPVIGVAFAGQNSDPDAGLAAQLSIEHLPDRSVLLGPNNKAYFGSKGFYEACKAALEHEFYSVKPKDPKPAQLNLQLIPFDPHG